MEKEKDKEWSMESYFSRRANDVRMRKIVIAAYCQRNFPYST